MDKKYELIPSDIEGLFRIKALKDFNDVKKGDIGGYIQSENNLSQLDDCWIYDNAVVRDNQILVMSKKLENFSAKYCCMTKLDAVSSRLMKQEIDSMIKNNMYGQFFEDSLVQMIMFNDFQLFSEDIAGKSWSEVDTVDDLLKAQQIHHANQ